MDDAVVDGAGKLRGDSTREAIEQEGTVEGASEDRVWQCFSKAGDKRGGVLPRLYQPAAQSGLRGRLCTPLRGQPPALGLVLQPVAVLAGG